MINIPLRASVLCAALLSAALTHAQSGSAKPGAAKPEAQTLAHADPSQADAALPPLVVPSAFAGYRKFSDVPVTSWRDANELTRRIGGWRAYAREAAAPDAAAAASAPAMQGHEGHERHKP